LVIYFEGKKKNKKKKQKQNGMIQVIKRFIHCQGWSRQEVFMDQILAFHLPIFNRDKPHFSSKLGMATQLGSCGYRAGLLDGMA